jgi:MinD superfamily P-loop ATPase
MRIAIASGKGGTGKTTLSTNLAAALAHDGRAVQYLDCDVEEPNGHIFLKPRWDVTQDVTVGVPQVDLDKCTGCGKCGQLCQYSAIVAMKGAALVFDQLCHSCGGCMAVCPTGAILEVPRRIGIVQYGSSNGIAVGQGLLDIGAIQSPAVIRRLKKGIRPSDIVILDAPPGTSCPVIEAIRGSDFVVLVTEPTPFGLNDLELAVGMVRQLAIPFAVAVNRCDMGDDGVVRYCRKEGIDVLLEIPNDRRIAEAYSRGEMMVHEFITYRERFLELYASIMSSVIPRKDNL